MRVSLNTVKQYTEIDLSINDLVKRINERLGGVEEVIDLGAKYKDAVIVRVVSAEQHPNADRLKVTKVDDGGVTPDVPRDDNGYAQVVCGAPNAREGIFAIWLPPKSTVPSSFDEAEPFVLDARELRGVLSQGMLAAGDELAINSDHDGIIEINPDEWKPSDLEIKPGTNFAKAYGLDDTIINIENKMFTHRPDLFGQIGVARELAGIQHRAFTSPSWYLGIPEFKTATGLDLEIFNDTPDNVPRFMAVAIKNIEVKPSPLWLQCALVALGSKSINNIVDATNYVMLLTAQPTHAYDYDKIRGHKIGARMAIAGEKITLLNHKQYELDANDIVIADAEGPVGLAGIMGGGESEVDATTRNIVLEVATFDMYTVRKTSMRHGLFTDALTRFNKGQSPMQNDHVLSLLMQSISDVSAGEQASDVFDEKSFADDKDKKFGNKWMPDTVPTSFVNERLGTTLTAKEMTTLLENVEFHSHDMDGTGDFCVTAPFWRTDIELTEDIVEEVGRLYGFDKLPRELPQRSLMPAAGNPKIIAKQHIRSILSRAGANEVLTYSFVHKNVLNKAAQNPEEAFRLGNALSPDLQYYRLSMLPSLLAHVHANSKVGYDEFLLFELGKAHHLDALDDDGLPVEFDRLTGVYAAKRSDAKAGSPYFTAKRYVELLLSSVNAKDVHYVKLADFDYQGHRPLLQLGAPFDPARSSMVMIGDRFVGVVGELKPLVRSGFKLPEQTAGFELFLSAFTGDSHSGYKPLSRYPGITQDISLKVASDISYEAIRVAVDEATRDSEFDIVISPLAIYQPQDDVAIKTVSFRFEVTSHDRTLREDEVTAVLDQVANTAQAAVKAERV